MFAPVVSRFRTYKIDLDETAQAYADAVWSLPSFLEWQAAAGNEPMIVDVPNSEDAPPFADDSVTGFQETRDKGTDMSDLVLPAGVELRVPAAAPGQETILTPEALAFIVGLERKFSAERHRLLAKRDEVQAWLDAGNKPVFPSETRKSATASGSWRRCRPTSWIAASRSPGRSIAR